MGGGPIQTVEMAPRFPKFSGAVWGLHFFRRKERFVDQGPVLYKRLRTRLNGPRLNEKHFSGANSKCHFSSRDILRTKKSLKLDAVNCHGNLA